jgi:hypothetical protein
MPPAGNRSMQPQNIPENIYRLVFAMDGRKKQWVLCRNFAVQWRGKKPRFLLKQGTAREKLLDPPACPG